MSCGCPPLCVHTSLKLLVQVEGLRTGDGRALLGWAPKAHCANDVLCQWCLLSVSMTALVLKINGKGSFPGSSGCSVVQLPFAAATVLTTLRLCSRRSVCSSQCRLSFSGNSGFPQGCVLVFNGVGPPGANLALDQVEQGGPLCIPWIRPCAACSSRSSVLLSRPRSKEGV